MSYNELNWTAVAKEISMNANIKKAWSKLELWFFFLLLLLHNNTPASVRFDPYKDDWKEASLKKNIHILASFHTKYNFHFTICSFFLLN